MFLFYYVLNRSVSPEDVYKMNNRKLIMKQIILIMENWIKRQHNDTVIYVHTIKLIHIHKIPNFFSFSFGQHLWNENSTY